MANDNSLVININGSAKEFLDEIDKVKKQTKSLDEVLTTTAKTSAAAFAGFAATIAFTTSKFASYEKALVGVGKTTNIEGTKLEKFGKQFQKLSSEIPISTNELLGIAQAAGQLGVTGEANLLKFTQTVAKLGVATDLAGEEAATSITRILNVTGEAIDTIDTFGSVIVALGNNFAATESEIVRMTTEVARSTAVFDVSAANAAALSTALKAVGVQAQLGGSAVGRGFRAIDEAIRNGGASLDNLSKITGIAGDKLKQTFEDDSVAVFKKFIEGLGEIDAAGGSTTQALESFGLAGDEILKVLPVLAKNSNILADTLRVANKEVQNATALNIEAEKAFATLDAELVRVNNNFTNASTNIGQALAPAVTELLKSVNGLLRSISELDKETISALATFIKWGAIITGSLTTVATLAAGFLKLRSIIRGLRVAFTIGRVAAIGFTGALTGGLSLVLGFLPEIIDGVKYLLGLLDKDTGTKSIDNINDKLKELNKERDALAKKPKIGGQGIIDEANLKTLDQEIKKLEELKKQRIETANTPVDLKGPTDAITGIENAPNELTQSVVNEISTEDKSLEVAKKTEDDKTALRDEATQKRVDAAKRENEELKNLEAIKGNELLNEDVAFLQKRGEINEAYAQANLIKDKEEKRLAIENLDLKHEEELARIAEKELRLDDFKATKREERKALDEEFRELDKEEQATFAEEDLVQLQGTIDSQKEAEQKAAAEKLQNKIKERNQFKQDEIKYGTEIAGLKKFFNSQEIQGTKDTSAQLAQLADSKNSTLKSIGKAAARVNAGIATAEGAIKAYTSLAGIPIVGPALGVAAAAALTAYGVEQQARISAMAGGGFVPNAMGGARDRVPTMLEPNELVVPAAVAPNFIQAAGIPDTQSSQAIGDQNSNRNVFEIILQDRASEFVTLEQREGRALGIIGA